MRLKDIEKAFEGYVAAGERGFNHFSVHVPIVDLSENKDKPEILYEVRAAKLDRQPGEICFPGGLIEDGESPEECALRETFEETGISPENIRIVTGLGSVFSTSGSQIHGFLGVVNEDAYRKMKINEDEVAETFTVSVRKLLDTTPVVYSNELIQKPDPAFPYEKVTGGAMYKWRNGRSPVPVYCIDDRVIWGLTGRITMNFLEEVRKCLR